VTQNDGELLDLVHLPENFDHVSQGNTGRILKGELADHYCKKNTLSEFNSINGGHRYL
jgi:hypothetical protein